MFVIIAWGIIQITIFAISVWLIVFGIRIWHNQQRTAKALFIVGFIGICRVALSVAQSGII